MTSKTNALFLVAIILLPAVGQAFAASTPDIADDTKEYQINGAGATFPFPLIDLWRVEYNKDFPNVNLNYQSIGSGGGIKQHIEKTVNFAASDAPMKSKEYGLAEGTLHIPEAIGAVTIAYNIPEVPNKGLKLTSDAVADIFLGKITHWNDPQITDVNPELVLPDEELVVIHRSDGSGTTFAFTDYLSMVSSEWYELVGTGKSVPWPAGVGSAGNEGVTATVKSTPYSVGYIELAYAFQTGVPYASIQNGDGTSFVEPSLDSIADAAAGASSDLPQAHESWTGVSIVNSPGQNSYPISTFTYLLVYEEIEQAVDSIDMAKAVVHNIHWMITDGQEFSPSLLYVPIPSEVQEIGKQGLARVTYNGEQIFDYESSSSGLKLPEWLKNNAKWWADGMISDEEYVTALQYLISQGILVV